MGVKFCPINTPQGAFGFGIFVPIADQVVHSLGKTSHPCGFAFVPHFIYEDAGISRSLVVLDVYLWCHNGARHQACITNISSLKTVPTKLVYMNQRFIFVCCTFISRKTVWNWIDWYFWNCGIFLNFYCFFANQCLTVWGITIVFPQVSLFKQFRNIFFLFINIMLILMWSQIVTMKSSWDEFFLEKVLFTSNSFFCAKIFSSGQ